MVTTSVPASAIGPPATRAEWVSAAGAVAFRRRAAAAPGAVLRPRNEALDARTVPAKPLPGPSVEDRDHAPELVAAALRPDESRSFPFCARPADDQYLLTALPDARDQIVTDPPGIGEGGRPLRARGAERRGRPLGIRPLDRRSRLGGPCADPEDHPGSNSPPPSSTDLGRPGLQQVGDAPIALDRIPTMMARSSTEIGP
jgi:hypothetical protein